MTQAVAANLYAVIDCPDKQTALASAAELDQFCADVDVLIGFNIISKDGAPFAGTKLRGLAESAGMKLMPDGSFHYLNDHGAQLFSLANLEPAPFSPEEMKHLATHGVTFLFDVPKATGGVQAFNQMLLAARQFMGPLSALMVDDNRRELTDSGIDKIRQQLAAIYAKMEQHEISPGSPRSKRLFA
jgi:FtsZ-interacting cell division protein ZipA